MFFRAPTNWSLTGREVWWDEKYPHKWVNAQGFEKEWSEEKQVWQITVPKYAVGWIEIPNEK